MNDVRAMLDADFAALYAWSGRPLMAPKRLLLAFFSIRTERHLMEQQDHSLPYAFGDVRHR